MGEVISNPQIKIGDSTYNNGTTGITRGNIYVIMNYLDTWSGMRYDTVNTAGYLFLGETRVAKLFEDAYDSQGEPIYPASLRYSAHNGLGTYNVSSYGVFDRLKIVQTNTDAAGSYNDDGEWWYYFNYGTPSTPSGLKLSANNVKPGTEVTLSWNASTANNNVISQYEVYEGNTKIATVESGTSLKVKASTSSGGSRKFKVRAIGGYGSLNSGFSPEITLNSYTYGTPTAPGNVKLSATYVKPGASSALSWDASSVTNDTIKNYQVFKNGTLLGSTSNASTRSYSVTANATAGKSDKFTVKAVGTDGGKVSAASSEVTLYAYSDPTAPTSVSVDNARPVPKAKVKLSWGWAVDGSYNAIQTYEVHRATSASGTYTKLKDGITGTSLDVEAPASASTKYYYKVKAVGVRSSSGLSSVYAELGANTTPNAPSLIGSGKTYNSRPYILITVGADTDGDLQSLAASGYTMSRSSGLAGGAHVLARRTSATAAGSEMCKVVQTDAPGATAEKSTSVTYAAPAWTDAAVKAGTTAVKAAHINELRTCLDDLCAYYGLAKTQWTDQIIAKVTPKKNWATHALELQETAKRIAAYINGWDTQSQVNRVTLPTFTKPTVPSADVINQLRSACAML